MAVRFLARAPRSAAEVAAHLERHRFGAETIRVELQALADLRYIDDSALALRRAEELLVRRHCGRLKVVHELTRRELADSVVEAAVSSVMDGRTDAELARQALRQRLRGKTLASRADRARAFRFLVSRGHPPEIVSEILDEEV